MAAKGYPDRYEKGLPIRGLEAAEKLADVKVFHAGTAIDSQGRVVTAGGRVLGVTALGDSIPGGEAQRLSRREADPLGRGLVPEGYFGQGDGGW